MPSFCQVSCNGTSTCLRRTSLMDLAILKGEMDTGSTGRWVLAGGGSGFAAGYFAGITGKAAGLTIEFRPERASPESGKTIAFSTAIAVTPRMMAVMRLNI